jgi:hypothetical protein
MTILSIPQLPEQSDNKFQSLIIPTIENHVIPAEAQRIALNFHSSKVRLQPIEMQLDRAHAKAPWRLRFMATFDVILTESKTRKELSLYFNFVHQWFYHADIGQCPIEHPEVQKLFSAWLQSFSKQLATHQLNNITVTVIQTI